jgi:hypothetical protein
MSIDRVIELEARKFQPTYKLVLLVVHSSLIKAATFVAKPFIKAADYFNETKFFQNYLDKK